MPLLNSAVSYGWLVIVVHWLSALLSFALFGLGYWMVGLDYYSEWYVTGPNIHKSIGILFMLLTFGRLFYKFLGKRPAPLSTHKRYERILAHTFHYLLYLQLSLLFLSGYIVVTGDGNSVFVFNWFEVPSVAVIDTGIVDLAGDAHKFIAWGLMAFVFVHAGAALKHHFIDRDRTLKRMINTD